MRLIELIKQGLKKYKNSHLKIWIERCLFYSTVLIFLVAVYEVGFLSHVDGKNWIHNIYYVYLLIYFIFFSTKIPNLFKNKSHIFTIIIRVLVFAFLLFYFLNVKYIFDAVDYHGFFYRVFTSPNFVYILIGITFFIEISKNTYKLFDFNLTPEILFALSFFVVIMLGAGLLMLPNATVSKISFIDALFTAVSATSITGLQSLDSAVYFTRLGQIIILFLLQIGGLGVMTFTSFIVYFLKESSFKAGLMLGDMMNSDKLGDAFSTIIQIVGYTFTIEIVGAIFIFFSINDSPYIVETSERVYFSIYNAISAFCNAGFTVIPGSMTSSIVFYNYSLKLIIATLAILGGIGFPILMNMREIFITQLANLKSVILYKKRFKHIPRLVNVNTKLSTLVSSILFVFALVSFFVLEYSNTLTAHEHIWQKIIDSFYYSAMPRSAGFNDVDLTNLRLPTLLIIMFLMWVGASPISTGGGIKTTTFGVAVLDIISILQGKDRLEIYKRKIANSTVRQAFAVIMISFIILACSVSLMSIFEEKNTEVSLTSLIFESISAYCTCGLSMGATGVISDSSKLLIAFLMYVGRIGALTLATAFFTKPKTLRYMYPKEKIYIG